MQIKGCISALLSSFPVKRSNKFNVQYSPFIARSWADPEGGGGGGGGGGAGVRTPLINHKNIGFHSNTAPDSLKNHKATKPGFNVEQSWAHQRNAI